MVTHSPYKQNSLRNNKKQSDKKHKNASRPVSGDGCSPEPQPKPEGQDADYSFGYTELPGGDDAEAADELSDIATASYNSYDTWSERLIAGSQEEEQATEHFAGREETMLDGGKNKSLKWVQQQWLEANRELLAKDAANNLELALTLAQIHPYTATESRRLVYSWRNIKIIAFIGFIAISFAIFPIFSGLLVFLVTNILHLFNILGNNWLFARGYHYQKHVTYRNDLYLQEELVELFMARHRLEKCDAQALIEDELKLRHFLQNIAHNFPLYSIIIPLYREKDIVPTLVARLNSVLYPQERLEIILALEADDAETHLACAAIEPELDAKWRIITIPNCKPRTKAKACNYALKYARGEYVAIFDAEDLPDPYQLLLAAEHFQLSRQGNQGEIVCLQARLNYYNYDENYLTRMFAIEYSAHFDYVMQGANHYALPLFLGGSSNHIKQGVLAKLRGWDIYNVTEDAELGWRIAQNHHVEGEAKFRGNKRNKINSSDKDVRNSYLYQDKANIGMAMLESYTLEEAPIKLSTWLRQRSRWLKGHLQTFIMLWGAPSELRMGWTRMLYAALMLFTPIMSMLLTVILPILWFILDKYRAIAMQTENHGDFIGNITINPSVFASNLFFQAFALVKIFALANMLFFLGSKLFQGYLVVKRKKSAGLWSSWVLVFMLFPFYFALHILAAFMALYETVFRPFYWHKTQHYVSEYFHSRQKCEDNEDKI